MPKTLRISLDVRSELDPAKVLYEVQNAQVWDELAELEAEDADTTRDARRILCRWSTAADDACVQPLDDDAPNPQPF